MGEQERKFFTPEEKARALFKERIEERTKLWKSIVNESNLNKENKSRFNELLSIVFNSIQHGGIEAFLYSIKTKLWRACVYSYQTDEALAIYKNIGSDIEEFTKEVYLA